METAINEKELKAHARQISVKEGSANSVMTGFGTRYITPYALALGAGNTIIGLLSSFPSLIGTISQLHGSKLIESVPRKKIVSLCALFQTLMWIPLLVTGYAFFYDYITSLTASVLLLVFYIIMVLFDAFKSPAWSSWMRDLLDGNTGKYFGKRTTIVGAVELFCMLTAGFLLDYFKGINLFSGFLLVFLIAFTGRIISSYLFTKQYEPKISPIQGYYFTFSQFLKKMSLNNFGRFVIFTTLLSFAVAIASPFFAVYMLKILNFTYYEYTLVTISSIVLTILTLPLWGKFADKYGNIKVIKISGIFVVFVPFLWLVSPLILENYSHLSLLVYLVLAEAFSGFWWAGLNLSTANFVYEAVTRERMAICVAYDNITTAFGVFVGAMIGGLISSLSFNILGLTPLLFIFLLSGIARGVVVLTILPKINEVRPVDKLEMGAIKEKIMLVPKYLEKGIFRAGY